ncbi:DUF2637 domain-containing protein [Actinomadura physcomitrii]|uniref:DUF2637 domain-containing protein n=1 Tax=Actinomadura physcomitrii TaxID=2650748 RepID=UPI0013715526|nr:DUF2637 domain-containing protein [Actinomadura physcomitrii]
MTAGDRIIRATTAATVIGVGAIAAVVSYRHALEVVRDHGETGVTAELVPLTVDGLVYVASMVLLDAARRRHQAPALARVALGLGIGATVAVNVLHGIAHGPVGAAIAAWPAVTLVVVVELLMGMIRRGRAAGAVDGRTSGGRPLVWWPVPPVPVGRPVASALEPDGPQVNGEAGEASAEADPAMVASARDRFGEMLANGDLPSVRAIRRELRVGHPRAVAVRSALANGHGLDGAGPA